MKYLIGLLCLFSVAQAQFAPTSAKSKFVNGIGIGSKDTSQFTAADTIALTIARDSVMYYRYRGFWRPIATGGNLSAYKLISDTLFANGYTTRARLKQGLDSLAATKVNISDTASMLAPYFRDSDTTGLLNQVVRTFGAQTVFGIKAFGDSMRIGAGLSVLRIQADAGISLSQELNIRKNTNSLSTDFLKIGTSVGSGILYGSYIKSTSNHLSFTGNDMVLGVTNTSGNNVDAISISSAGVTSINSLSTAGIVTNTSAGVLGTTSIVPIANGGTGSSTQNFVDLTTSQTITGQKTFNVSGNSGNVIINHGSGSGVALNITKGGNGEGLIVNKTSGSGNAATITGTLEATTLVKNGGTSSQFLKADGSVDNNTYTTTSQNALKLNISDTAAMLLPYTRVQRFTDSLTNVQSRIQTKQNILTLTTTGTSGAATLVGSTLNIPQYQSVLTNPVTGTGTTNYLPKFTGSTTVGNSQVFDDGTNVGIGTTSPVSRLEVFDGDVSVTTSGAFSFFNSNRNFIPNGGGVSLGAYRYRGYSTGTTYQVGSGIWSFSSAAWNSTSTPAYLSFQTTNVGSTSPTEKMLLDASGNLGLGVTPSAWRSGDVVIDLGATTSLVNAQSQNTRIYTNAFVASGGTNTYKTTNFATYYDQGSGQHRWFTAPSGTAGNAITFTQAMTLGANGNLLLNTTTDNGARFQVAGSATFTKSGQVALITQSAAILSNGVYALDVDNSAQGSNMTTAGAFRINTGGNTAAFVVNGLGNVGIGIGSPAYKLDVQGTLGVTGALSADGGIIANGNVFQPLIVRRATNSVGAAVEMPFQFLNSSSAYAPYSHIRSYIVANTAGAQSGGLRFSTYNGGVEATQLEITNTGAATFSSLAGTGTRVVEASSTGLLSATKVIDAGTYTPTVTIESGGGSSPSANVCRWTRVGNIVTVTGNIYFEPQGSGYVTKDNIIRITYPIARTSTGICSGPISAYPVGGVTANVSGYVSGTSTSWAQLHIKTEYSGSGCEPYFTFSYEVD